jgi:ABC-type phosphate transport system substrate-binding protein
MGTMINLLSYGVRFMLFMVLLEISIQQPVNALEIVANRDISTNQLTHIELQAIFTMRMRVWPDGVPIRVFVFADSAPEQVDFAKKILETFPYQLRRYWDRLVFSGTGQAPIEVASSGEMYNRITSTPGAIGYLPVEYITKEVHVIKLSIP